MAADHVYMGEILQLKSVKRSIEFHADFLFMMNPLAIGKGYVVSQAFTFKAHLGKDRSKTTTYWTQKGRKLIYDVLKDNDILPLIERDDIA